MKEKLLNCGRFAKICGVEKHVLFHYDEIKLFQPHFVDEKGYRFYTYHQYETFKMIITLKNLGMSLKDIAIYLDNRNPEVLLLLLKQQEKKLIAAKKKLNQVHDMLKSMQTFTYEGIHADINDISLVHLDARPILVSANVEDVTDKSFAAYMHDYITFLEKHNIMSGEYAGIIMRLENIRSGRTANYSYMYTYSHKKTASSSTKKEGLYLCGYHKGDYTTIKSTYDTMLVYADEHNITLGEYSYEEYLLSEFSDPHYENYVTRINIEVKSA